MTKYLLVLIILFSPNALAESKREVQNLLKRLKVEVEKLSSTDKKQLSAIAQQLRKSIKIVNGETVASYKGRYSCKENEYGNYDLQSTIKMELLEKLAVFILIN